MKLHYLSLGLSFVLGAAAQGIGNLSPCVQECVTGALPESCSTYDINCICSAKSFISEMSCCVAQKCPKDKQEQALGFARNICHGAGVSDLPKSPSCASTTGGGSQATATATAATTTNAFATDATSTSAASTESASGSDSTSSSGTGSSTASAASESSTNAAATFGQYKDAALAAAAGAAAFAVVA